MKPCQLCGACSWGPVKGMADMESIQPDPRLFQLLAPRLYLGVKEVQDFRCCDVCGTLAALAQIEDSSSSVANPMLSPPPGPFDQVMMQVSSLLGAPKPETRTERFMRALLMSTASATMSATELVGFVRRIEGELDGSPADPFYRFQLCFTDRVALQTWVAAGLHDTDCPTYLERSLAHQFADWVEERAPRRHES